MSATKPERTADRKTAAQKPKALAGVPLPSKDFIRECREKQKLTLEQMAQRSGVNRSTIWRMETEDGYLCTGPTFCALMEAAGLSKRSKSYAAGVAMWQADKLKDHHGKAPKSPHLKSVPPNLRELIHAEIKNLLPVLLAEYFAKGQSSAGRSSGRDTPRPPHRP